MLTNIISIQRILEILSLFPNSIWETIYMVAFSSLFSVLMGLPIGIILVVTKKGNIRENIVVNNILNTVINITRSVPFLILMIVLFPLTRLIVGKTIGTTATIIPLSIAAAPFVARLIESALLEVDPGVIEAAQSMGANSKEIIIKVLLPEALPSIVLGITITIINLIGYSAMAGAIGGGGLGDLAIR
ncbi:MAG: ABC transporter permease, partial [Firmicutes bacterium]|nr:ABC transporter permease [Bacillota bacterium]